MPRKSKGARLYQERNGRFYIRDGGRFLSTGTRDRGEAETALAAYIVEKGRPSGPATPERLTVADVLDRYATERAPHVKDPARIGYAVQALVPILGALPVASLTGEVCRRYAATRAVAPGTARKELGTLQAAINYTVREGYLTAGRLVALPPKSAPRDRWLTRDEVAALVRAAYRNPKARHLARFILIAAYTGTRSGAILGLRFMPHTQGGWIDTDKGILYRRASGEAETKKRTPPAPIPSRLLAHLRRWESMGARWAVEVEGQRVGHVKTAWRTALAEAGIEHCTRHDLRHTAITWAMQRGANRWDAAGYFGLTVDMLESTYGHHHPDHMRSAVEAMGRRNR